MKNQHKFDDQLRLLGVRGCALGYSIVSKTWKMRRRTVWKVFRFEKVPRILKLNLDGCFRRHVDNTRLWQIIL